VFLVSFVVKFLTHEFQRQGMQVKPALKAAVPALPRKDFRVPPTSVHNPNTPAARKRNRGPPK
jgi:hypothetical protein